MVQRSQPVYREEQRSLRKDSRETDARDPETGVDYFLTMLRPFFVKDLQSVFLYRFFQMLRCNRGQTDHQKWMVKYEIARQKAVDAWLDAMTPKPIPGEAEVTAQVTRLREAARDRRRQEVRRDWVGAPGDLAAAVNAVELPEATDTCCVAPYRRLVVPSKKS